VRIFYKEAAGIDLKDVALRGLHGSSAIRVGPMRPPKMRRVAIPIIGAGDQFTASFGCKVLCVHAAFADTVCAEILVW